MKVMKKILSFVLVIATLSCLIIGTAVSSSAASQSGWKYSNGNWYYLDTNGNTIKSKWIKDGADWYYLDNSG